LAVSWWAVAAGEGASFVAVHDGTPYMGGNVARCAADVESDGDGDLRPLATVQRRGDSVAAEADSGGEAVALALFQGSGPSSLVVGRGVVCGSMCAASRAAASGSRSPSRCSHPLRCHSKLNRFYGSARSFSAGRCPSGSMRGPIWHLRNRRNAAGRRRGRRRSGLGSDSFHSAGARVSESESWKRINSSRCSVLISPECRASTVEEYEPERTARMRAVRRLASAREMFRWVYWSSTRLRNSRFVARERFSA
jgi:hypothetical protein